MQRRFVLILHKHPGLNRRFIYTLLLLLCTGTVARAQLCQGSLGDPIVSISFGAGSNPGPPLQAAATGYQYVSTDCPSDGFYTVRNNTSNCFGSTWHNVNSDHTGDAGGYFMMVNASIQPSEFYLDTVRGLCSNTTFEFAAWVMNVLLPSSCGGNGNQPDLTFRIEKTDGTLLQSYNTGGISTLSTPSWKQYGFFFTTPAGVPDVVLRIRNNAPGGCGNDLALDDISFRPCGPLLTPSITGLPVNTVSFCQGFTNNYQFNCMVSGGYTNPAYQWQQSVNNGSWTDIPGANSNNWLAVFPANLSPGTYNYRLAVAETGNINSLQCRVNSSIISVIINPPPVTTASNNGPACEKNSIQLNASGGLTYSWTGPAGFSASIVNPIVSNLQMVNGGKYYVFVKDANNCLNLDSTNVVINPAPKASLAFSDATICAGQSIVLSGSGGSSWQWTPATGLSSTSITNPTASPVDTTRYLFIAGNSFTCYDSAYVTVNVAKIPIANAGSDRTMIAGNTIKLSGTISGQYAGFSWTPALHINNTMTLQPLVNPRADIDYILNVDAANGCGRETDTMHIKVYGELFIPNAFTPDGNGINDTWNIPALAAYGVFELVVYNRFGEAVFNAKKTPLAWDGKYRGKDQPAGTYTYFIDLKNGLDPLRGTVLIIR